jgi:hypothetical protein
VTRQQLQSKFPNASPAFIKANEANNLPSSPKPKRPVPVQPVAATGGEGQNPKSILVRVTSFRRRLIDPDNLCPKYFVDCLRYAGLITDDSSKFIILEVRQGKADEDRTEIELI